MEEVLKELADPVARLADIVAGIGADTEEGAGRGARCKKGASWTKMPKFPEMGAWLEAQGYELKREGNRAWVLDGVGKVLGEGRDRRRVIRAVRRAEEGKSGRPLVEPEIFL